MARYLFTDYDETLIPKKSLVDMNSLRSLEEKLMVDGYFYTWISGSSINYLLEKSEKYISHWPKYIASSLGSELYIHEGGGQYSLDRAWVELLTQYGVNSRSVSRAEAFLKREFKGLELQDAAYQGTYKRSYYCIEDHLPMIRSLSNSLREIGFRVVVSKCSPLAGDPPDQYDVDLIPTCGGKGNLVKFITRGDENFKSIGFGDSENDLEMLSEVDYAFWVGNSLQSADQKIMKTTGFYASGITEGIDKAFHESV